MALTQRLLVLRRSPVLLRLPPYLSALCTLIGVAWLLILPLNEYSRQTYISENAILPGQVHTYFGGSEHNVFRAYRQHVFELSQKSREERLKGLGQVLKESGIKVANQPYEYHVAGQEIKGTNVYGLLRGPKADGTEAMVLIAAWKNFDDEINHSGVALALTLARYFRRWSIWSKDILVLFPEDSTYGPHAWTAAYHSTALEATSSQNISALPIRAGALQGAVALDYPAGPWGQRFDKLDIMYDGINGALPNLDLLNTAIAVAGNQVGIGCSLHGITHHSDRYMDRLKTLAKGVATQGVGHANGPHSAFMPYHVDAITLKTMGDGWHDEMGLGRVTESLFRSINNLLEKFHQSFFFYILINANRFVSIGNYLPAAMLIAGNFTITALALWVQSGVVMEKASEEKKKLIAVPVGGKTALIPDTYTETAPRHMFLPAITLLATYFASSIILYMLNYSSSSLLPHVFQIITATSIMSPVPLGLLVVGTLGATIQQIQILQSFSLILLGAILSTVATLNFSLAFVIGILAAPLSFLRPLPGFRRPQDTAITATALVIWAAVSPSVILKLAMRYLKLDVRWVLVELARGWVAQGAWTSLLIWSVWWPTWIVGGIVLFSGLVRRSESTI